MGPCFLCCCRKRRRKGKTQKRVPHAKWRRERKRRPFFCQSAQSRAASCYCNHKTNLRKGGKEGRCCGSLFASLQFFAPRRGRRLTLSCAPPVIVNQPTPANLIENISNRALASGLYGPQASATRPAIQKAKDPRRHNRGRHERWERVCRITAVPWKGVLSCHVTTDALGVRQTGTDRAPGACDTRTWTTQQQHGRASHPQ